MRKTLRIVTWNINSVRLRISLLARLVEEASPDIVCLQEIKVADEHFPVAGIKALGFPHVIFSGQKGYHGVAILSKVPLENVHVLSLLDSPDRRHIAATLPDGTELHNLYIPAGGDIPDREQNPYFGFKLDYVDALKEWFTKARTKNQPMIAVGDFNIAPHEHDVWSHKALLNVVSHTPAEVERLNALQADLEWLDTARYYTPHSEKLYSWWSYRNRDWRASNRGRRLDHVWITQPLSGKLRACSTLTDARDWPQPSDHVPVVAELELSL